MTARRRCFITARPASAARHIAKTLAQTAVFWLLFLFLLPAVIWHLETAARLDAARFTGAGFRSASIVLFILASCLGLSSGLVMAVRGAGTPLPVDCPRRLVCAGPYRFVRNPMAVAGILQGVAVGLYLGSPAVIAYALTGAVLWHVAVRPAEERDLAERFGGAYAAYRRAVRCWIPRLRGYCPPPQGTPHP